MWAGGPAPSCTPTPTRVPTCPCTAPPRWRLGTEPASPCTPARAAAVCEAPAATTGGGGRPLPPGPGLCVLRAVRQRRACLPPGRPDRGLPTFTQEGHSAQTTFLPPGPGGGGGGQVHLVACESCVPPRTASPPRTGTRRPPVPSVPQLPRQPVQGRGGAGGAGSLSRAGQRVGAGAGWGAAAGHPERAGRAERPGRDCCSRAAPGLLGVSGRPVFDFYNPFRRPQGSGRRPSGPRRSQHALALLLLGRPCPPHARCVCPLSLPLSLHPLRWGRRGLG